jgi:phosphatidylinositol-bisphosphatase
MALRQNENVDMQSFLIFIGTWNINGQLASESLRENWLACDPSPPHIYVIGFQELDWSNEAFVSTDSPREAEWLRRCVAGLHPNGHYKMVKLVRLMGMMLVVFATDELSKNIKKVDAGTVGTGIPGKVVCQIEFVFKIIVCNMHCTN